MDLKLNGKIAVVAAASKGLGKAVAEALAKEGASLAICARNNEQLVQTANYLTDTYKTEVLTFVCDVSNQNDITRFREKVIERFKTVHILFTNAGGPPAGKLLNFTNDDINKAINLNLLSTANLVSEFLPYMQNQKWGRIIASTSSNVKQLLPQFPLSNISRNSVVAYMKTLAMEVASMNITANILAPGLFLTDPTKQDILSVARKKGIEYEEVLKQVASKIPVQKIGNPDDYGSLAAFLSSEQAGFITGETILIDGGEYSNII